MPTATRTRSTADERRAHVLDCAVPVFARTGYHATPVTDIAVAAGISQGYVIRLFHTKLELFVAVVDQCFVRITETLDAGADAVIASQVDAGPDEILAAMSDAYVELITDRNLLMLQVHAQSASDIPEIRDAMRRGLASVVELVRNRSHAGEDAVQRFIAYGQLCHLIVTAELDQVDRGWAEILTHGIRHVAPPQTPSRHPDRHPGRQSREVKS